jgi:hypothetical protein
MRQRECAASWVISNTSNGMRTLKEDDQWSQSVQCLSGSMG